MSENSRQQPHQSEKSSNELSELGGQHRGGRKRAFNRAIRSLVQARLALFGVIVLTGIVLMALFGPFLNENQPNTVNLMDRLTGPVGTADGSTDYLLGTDQLGRDIFARVIYGAQVSLLVGFSVVFFSGFIGFVLGLPAGYYGGMWDSFIMRLADIQLAFPTILLAVAVMAVIGSGLINVVVVLAIATWVIYGRVIRGQVLSLKEKEFVEAARAIGASDLRIIVRHILPNMVAPVIVIASFSVAQAIISEASLSFLGLGVPLSTPTWGGMLAEGRDYIRDAWWLVVMPGAAIMLTVLGINTVGDWIRDLLDPYIM
jgi:peptide/nickel transport system permease protein